MQIYSQTNNRRGVYPAVLFFSLGLATNVHCAFCAEPPKPQADNAEKKSRPTSEVYLNDSFEASDALAKARLLGQSGRWHDAAEILQQAIDKSPGKITAIRPRFYIDLRRHIQDTIARWPVVGVRAYQDRFESEAELAIELIHSEHDIQRLLDVYERYFCTMTAASLADTIGQLAVESGDLWLAERVYRRVLKAHPNADRFRDRYERLATLIATIRDSKLALTGFVPRDSTIRWKGEDREFKEVVQDIHSSFRLSKKQTETDWPTFGGDGLRNKAGTVQDGDLGLLWRFDEFGQVEDSEDQAALDDAMPSGRNKSRWLVMNPVASSELIIVQRYREIVALYRSTGYLAWRFQADEVTVPITDLDELPFGWDSVTIEGNRIYASLPGDTVPYYGYESARTPPALVCLDATTGVPIWSLDQTNMGEGFSEVSFDTAPIVRNGNVFVVGRRRRSFGFEDCYLHRFRASDGTLEQRTHLGSASTGSFGSRRPTSSIAAIDGDTVYVCTNLGTLAAVSVHTGAVRWVHLYDRGETPDNSRSNWDGRFLAPWMLNPVILSDGRVIALPTDASSVIVLNAQTGEVEHAIPKRVLGGAQSLLGVHENVLCTAGNKVACFDLESETLSWSTLLGEDQEMLGRPTWADNRVLVPTSEKLLSFAVSDGSLNERNWQAYESGGNLLALSGSLLVAGPGTLTAYVRKADLWNTLRKKMEASETDPIPALEFAEVALRGGEYEDALTVFQEAIRRAGDLAVPFEPAIQSRVFENTLLFAETFATRAAFAPSVLDDLFRYAAQCPTNTKDHVRYRLRFAKLYAENKKPGKALRLYQQLLRDRSLRAMDSAKFIQHPGIAVVQTVGSLAESRITELLDRHGRVAYQPYETEAQQILRSGQRAHEIETLARVVEVFPNSKAAPEAMLTWAQYLVESKKPSDAARILTQAYQRYGSQVDRPATIHRIADAYEQAGRPAHTYRWLTKALREYPEYRINDQGSLLSFRQYRDRLTGVRELVQASEPHIRLPLSEYFEQTFADKFRLLIPRFGSAPSSDWSRYYIYSGKSLHSHHARTSREAWSAPIPTRQGVQLLIARADVAVFATSHVVFGVRVNEGTTKWSVGKHPAELDDENADWEGMGGIRTFALQGDQLVVVHDDGKIVRLDIRSGQVVWSQTHKPVPQGLVCVADPWIVYYVMRDGHVALCRIDYKTGEWIGASPTDEARSVENLFVTLDGRIVLVTTQTITAFDAETGRKKWRVPMDGHLRKSSLQLDVDAIYFSDDGRSVRKIDLERGETIWQSEPVTSRSGSDMIVQRQNDSIIVSARSSVSAIDEVTGLTLWHGTAPEDAHFSKRILTSNFVAAIHTPDNAEEMLAEAYFYDHRNASGMLAEVGGIAELMKLSEVREIMIVDDTLLIESGTTLHAWSSK